MTDTVKTSNPKELKEIADNIQKMVEEENTKLPNDLKITEADLASDEFSKVFKGPNPLTGVPGHENIHNEEKLNQLKEYIDKMPRDEVNKLMANLARNNMTNPNNNSFSTSSTNEMRRAKLKNIINQRKMQRNTNHAKEIQQKKYEDKLQQEKEKQEKPSEDMQRTNTVESHKCDDEKCQEHHD